MPRKLRRRALTGDAIVQHVIELEKRVWEAATKRDAEAFRQLVPSDGIMIFRSGIMRQPDYLATMKSRTVGHSKWRRMKGFRPNPTTVILTYETVRVGSYRGKKFPSNPVIESTTWIKRGKRWVAILNQETPLTA
ncbi:MAG TPA: nuclear transport factor 2 family protein [Candidatus Acidoferrum sp.]